MNSISSNISPKRIVKIAHKLKVVSHPIRLQVLQAIDVNGPLTVGEIKKKINSDIEQSMLSHHLIKMKDTGVLSSSKRGKFNVYNLRDKDILKIFSLE